MKRILAALALLAFGSLAHAQSGVATVLRFNPNCAALQCGNTGQVCVSTASPPGVGTLNLCDLSTGFFAPVVTGGSGAPVGAEFIVNNLNATLSGERDWTDGDGILSIDGGANGTFTVRMQFKSGTAAPTAGDCDDAAETDRVYHDTDDGPKGRLYLCGGTAGWQEFGASIQYFENIYAKGPTPWTDPTALGAKCDGATDDTTAFQAALNGRGNVRVPVSTSGCVVSTLYIRRRTTLSGFNHGLPDNAQSSRLILKAGTNADLLRTENLEPGFAGDDNMHSIFIRDLTLDGNKANNSAGHCLHMVTTGFASSLTNVATRQCKEDGVRLDDGGGASTAFSDKFVIREYGAAGNDGYGINAIGDTGYTGLLIDTAKVDNCQGGIRISGGTGQRLNHVIIQNYRSEVFGAVAPTLMEDSIVLDTVNGGFVDINGAHCFRGGSAAEQRAGACVRIVAGSAARLTMRNVGQNDAGVNGNAYAFIFKDDQASVSLVDGPIMFMPHPNSGNSTQDAMFSRIMNFYGKSGDSGFRFWRYGESNPRLQIQEGTIGMGDGAGAIDSTISRIGTNSLGLGDGDALRIRDAPLTLAETGQSGATLQNDDGAIIATATKVQTPQLCSGGNCADTTHQTQLQAEGTVAGGDLLFKFKNLSPDNLSSATMILNPSNALDSYTGGGMRAQRSDGTGGVFGNHLQISANAAAGVQPWLTANSIILDGANGNVGIGTGVATAPAGKLHVAGDARFKGPSPWADLKAFGAVCDGVTDDTTAITNTINSLPASGGEVLHPGGDCKVTSLGPFTTQGIYFRCAGAGGHGSSGNHPCRLISSTNGAVILTLGSAASTAHSGWKIESITFRDSSAGGDQLLGGIKILRMNNVTLEGVSIDQIGRDGAISLEFDGTGDFTQFHRVNNIKIRTGAGDGTSTAIGVKATAALVSTTFYGGTIFGPGASTSSTGMSILSGSDGNSAISVEIDGWGTSIALASRFWDISGPLLENSGNAGTAISITGDFNQVIGGAIVNFATGISIASGVNETKLLGVGIENITTHLVDAGDGTTVVGSINTVANVENMVGLFGWNDSSGTGKRVGFAARDLPNLDRQPRLLIPLNNALVLSDDLTTDGGLALSADSATRAVVGQGVYGDIAAPRSNATTASQVQFNAGAIRFYTDSGLTVGNTFTPTQRWNIDTSGNFVSLTAGTTVDGRNLDNVVDLAGQLGGAVTSPDVRGIRETGGPTLLTIGPISDGECLARAGTTIDGTTCGGGGAGAGGGGPNFATSFTSQTSVTVLGTDHDMNNKNLLVTCYDNASPAALVEPASVTVHPTSFDVVITFASAQTGYCVVNGTGPPNYATTFTSQTSVTVTGATHALKTADLDVTVWDSDTGTRNLIEPASVAVDSTTFDVTVTFASSQSGRLLISAGGGAAPGGGGGSGDPVLIDGAAVADSAGVNLQGGAGLAYTFDTGTSPDTATLATASSEVGFISTGSTLTCGIGESGKMRVHATEPLQYCNGAATSSLHYVATGDSTGAAENVGADSVNLGPETVGNYVAAITGGDGIVASASGENATITVDTKSDEAGFLEDLNNSDLACGGGTEGQAVVNNTDPFQYCDGLGTRRTAAYADDAGRALLGDNAASFFAAGELELARGGTNQASWIANRCVRVNAGGTALEPAGADCGVGGGGGDNVSVDGSGVVDPNFDDGGDIDFTATGSPATVTAAVKANSVALTTDTTGNYAAGDGEAGNATGLACGAACVSSSEADATFVLDTETVAGIDSTAIHDNQSAEISAIAEKTSPVGTDLLIIEDSAAGNAKKRLQIANFPQIGSNWTDEGVVLRPGDATDDFVRVSGDTLGAAIGSTLGTNICFDFAGGSSPACDATDSISADTITRDRSSASAVVYSYTNSGAGDATVRSDTLEAIGTTVGSLVLTEADPGSDTVTHNVGTLTGNSTFTWPNAPSASALLKSTSAGVLSFVPMLEVRDLDFASCIGAVASLEWDDPANGDTRPTAACNDTGNIQRPSSDFSGSAVNTIEKTFTLPADWTATGGLDLNLRYVCSGTCSSGNFEFDVSTVCRAAGESWEAAYNAAQTITDAFAAANTLNDAAQAALTVTGCAAGEDLTIRISRDGTNDTNNDLAKVLKGTLTLRRTP